MAYRSVVLLLIRRSVQAALPSSGSQGVREVLRELLWGDGLFGMPMGHVSQGSSRSHKAIITCIATRKMDYPQIHLLGKGVFLRRRGLTSGMELGEAGEVADFPFINREDRESNRAGFAITKSHNLFGVSIFEGDVLGGAIGKGKSCIFDAVVEDVTFSGASATVGNGDSVKFLGHG